MLGLRSPVHDLRKDRKMFWLMLLGHLAGDYLFQTGKMAELKVQNRPAGYIACFIHCTVYSAIVVLFIHSFRDSIDLYQLLLMWLMVFITHFPIDKWSLGKIWLNALGRKDVSYETQIMGDAFLYRFFYWFVYVVIDNTLHLILMTAGFIWLFPEFVGIG